MTKQFFAPGDHIVATAPSALSSGDPVQIGQFFGTAQDDAANGAQFVLVLVGVHRLPKNTSEAWTQGQLLYWDGTEVRNASATGRLLIGAAAEAATAAATHGKARLDGASRADVP